MIYVGEEPISALMLGEMGIKTAAVGGDVIYTRPGGFIYLELTTTQKENENG